MRVGGTQPGNQEWEAARVAPFGAPGVVSLGLCPQATQTRATGMENALSNLCGGTAGPQPSPHPRGAGALSSGKRREPPSLCHTQGLPQTLPADKGAMRMKPSCLQCPLLLCVAGKQRSGLFPPGWNSMGRPAFYILAGTQGWILSIIPPVNTSLQRIFKQSQPQVREAHLTSP